MQEPPAQTSKPVQEQKPIVTEVKPEIKAEQKISVASPSLLSKTTTSEKSEVLAKAEEEKPFSITAEEYIKKYLTLDQSVEEIVETPPKEAEKIPPTAPVKEAKAVETPPEPTPETERQKIEYRIIGEAFNAYIIVEVGEKILLIDKHAAHERIIFEQMKQNMYAKEATSQLLMLPIEVMLMSDEVAAIEEYREELEAVGFEFTSSRNTVQITALPVGIEQDAAEDMFTVIADRVKSGTGSVNITRNIIFEKALYQASCKAAIKAGREYAAGHQKWVVEKLMEIPDITVCPHGRPVAMELSKRNIDHQFNRV